MTVDEYVELFNQVWDDTLDGELVKHALANTTNITARCDKQLVGCVRVLSDGYLSSFITEVLLHPTIRHLGVSQHLLSLAYEYSPTSIMFGSQNAPGVLMEEIGWSRGPNIYFKRK